MKKFIAAVSLAIASSTAFAAGTTLGLQYDMDHANRNSSDFTTANELKVSLAQETVVGTLDAGLIGARYLGSPSDNAYGFEVGYSNGVKYNQIGLRGRLAYGRLNNIDPNGGGFTGNASYASLGVEGTMPLTEMVSGFVGYRHRHGLNDDTISQNRYTAGVDFAVDKSVALRVGYAYTRAGELQSNGLTAGMSYTF